MPVRPRSLLIVTDAWYPQVNGVVRSVDMVAQELRKCGVEVSLITPAEFRTFPMPGYGEIGLSLTTPGPVVRRIEALKPEAIHIATEGPLGLFARHYCLKRKLPFSTAYHTQFPEYLRARVPVPLKASYAMMKWFHRPATACLVGTPYLKACLVERGFTNTEVWTKGVDTVLFNPAKRQQLPYPGPVFLYVGRVAVEKNIEAFLRVDLPGTKLVVGDGPSFRSLRAAYPEVTFLGARHNEELARLFASADVFVFPSRTDTFGLVLLEALASGTPVAAYPVTGPIDVIGKAPVGVLDNDLRAAALGALDVPRAFCRSYAEGFSWAASAEQFLSHQTVIAPR
ncbi:MAG: glycosyltransferase family 1 protein [Devosia nanyangense]|uniref:Glycosyltransferase family 1 protein n=1 Tax=Devosia nanyangense TaxID=1228055 RepID=A0A933NXB8_9HYPH|nr:glycosyltransferase family 1 protein [Devosia nanyangense]